MASLCASIQFVASPSPASSLSSLRASFPSPVLSCPLMHHLTFHMDHLHPGKPFASPLSPSFCGCIVPATLWSRVFHSNKSRSGSGWITPIASSNTNGGAEGILPGADFYKVEAILRPWRLSHVTSGLIKIGIRGVTVSDVRGIGAQGGSRERQAGSEFFEDNFVSKVKLEVVVSKDQVETVISAIIDEARTGEIGDGKIFVIPVADVIRVRTGERGLPAERMAGGRADLLSSKCL